MNLAIGIVAVVAAALLQLAVMPAFTIFGVHPNLIIALLIAWMTARGPREALVMIPVAGFAIGLLDSQPLGLAMLALAPLTLMTNVRELRLVDSDLLPAILLAVVATLVYETVILLSLVVRGERPEWVASILDVLVPAAIVNALILLPVFGLIRLASVDLRQPRAF